MKLVKDCGQERQAWPEDVWKGEGVHPSLLGKPLVGTTCKLHAFCAAASTQVKPEPEYSAPIGDILKQHAADFSMDSDLGATRLNSAISHHGYSINAATGPSRLMPDNPSGLHPDEETICYQVSIMLSFIALDLIFSDYPVCINSFASCVHKAKMTLLSRYLDRRLFYVNSQTLIQGPHGVSPTKLWQFFVKWITRA